MLLQCSEYKITIPLVIKTGKVSIFSFLMSYACNFTGNDNIGTSTLYEFLLAKLFQSIFV